MKLPHFKYHPDPIASDVIEHSDKACQCCGQVRGYIYTSSFYTAQDIDDICPWCIADGSAAKKFNGCFSDDYPLLEAGIPLPVIIEVCERTPSFHSWQQEAWQSHCGKACEFLGDAEREDLNQLQGAELANFLTKEQLPVDIWPQVLQRYQKGGQPAIYKFRCLECRELVFYLDYT